MLLAAGCCGLWPAYDLGLDPYYSVRKKLGSNGDSDVYMAVHNYDWEVANIKVWAY
jgi:hypothetical protein